MSRGRAGARWIERVWYEDAPGAGLLVPLSWLFRLLVAVRRRLFALGLLRRHRAGAPVIVVGNLTVGGTGKTPFAIWLVGELQRLGRRPAIVSRGYGGLPSPRPRRVSPSYDARRDGDEPVLLAEATGVPVYVCADRVAAARAAVDDGADVIVSDDGLQHYRLQRDLEIVMLDGERRLGNGRCLPAGPLREPASRLDTVDLVVTQTEQGQRCAPPSFRLDGSTLVRLGDGTREPLDVWRGREVVAMAAIGHPERFFRQLERAGLRVHGVGLPDHAPASAYPLVGGPGLPVVVTEKDAVKLRAAGADAVWMLPVRACLDDASAGLLRDKLSALFE